ncbi:hypothetical protein Ddc_02173 [Ditylenchus destructor]|nr:hypothetical protein Ddc_02173 [Ditylenchus destructor]
MEKVEHAQTNTNWREWAASVCSHQALGTGVAIQDLAGTLWTDCVGPLWLLWSVSICRLTGMVTMPSTMVQKQRPRLFVVTTVVVNSPATDFFVWFFTTYTPQTHGINEEQ